MNTETATATIDEFPGYTFYRDGRATNKYGQFIGHINKSGYVDTRYTDKNGKRCHKNLHTMIMWAFSGEPPNGRDVDHINGIKNDNRYENLQYLDKRTHSQKTNKENPRSRKNVYNKPIECIDKDGNITKYDSINDMARTLEPNTKLITMTARIRKSIKNNTPWNGYTFRIYKSENIENEIWKKPNIEGIDPGIEVSNMGRLKRNTGKIISEFKPRECGYIRVGVKINGKNVNKRLHTLVCSAFHGKQPEWASSVNHIDANPLNNKADNLEWSDPIKQTSTFSVKVHLLKNGKIEHTFNSIKEANTFLNVSLTGVNNCLSGKNKTIKGYTVLRDPDAKEIKKTKQKGNRIVNTKNIICQLDNHKNLIKEFPTAAAAVRELKPDISYSQLHSKCGSIRKAIICNFKCLDYYWSYKNPLENIDELREKILLNCKKISHNYHLRKMAKKNT